MILKINFVFLSILIIALVVELIALNSDVFNPVTIIGSLIVLGAIAYSCAFFIWNMKLFKATRYLVAVDPVSSKDSFLVLIFGVIGPYLLIIADLIAVGV